MLSNIVLIVTNYNQELEIDNFLSKLRLFFPVKDTVVVDDGSTDLSVKIARDRGYNVIVHGKNKGVGAALRSGFFYAIENNYENIVVMSSNGKMKPEEINKVVTPVLRGEVDYVTGNRFMPGGSSPKLGLFRYIAIRSFSFFCWPLLGRYFSDISCGFRCYKTALLQEPTIDVNQEWLDRYEMEYYLHFWACKLKYKIKEVPVTILYDHLPKHRRSKIKPIVGWWSMVRPYLILSMGIRR